MYVCVVYVYVFLFTYILVILDLFEISDMFTAKDVN